MNKWMILLFLALTTNYTFAQKKKADVAELDLIRGQYHKRNTIGPFSGTVTEKYFNGKKKTNIPLKDGRVHGVAKEWEKNGTKVYEANYVHGKQQGLETQWYATGVKKVELNYVDDQPHGMFTEWHKNEQKKAQGHFKNGKEEGKHEWWFNTGQIDQEVFYKNGQTDGVVKNWFPNGQQQLISHYVAGQKQGETTKWFINGQKKSQEFYNYDVLDQESKYWDKYGVLRAIRIYDKGKLVKDINYRSGNINIGNGYLQVYNDAESFYKVALTGERVLPVDVKDITYVIDGTLVQLYNVSCRDFLDTSRVAKDDTELLNRYLTYESDLLQETDPEFDFAMQKDFRTSKTGKTLLHWYFNASSSASEEQTPRTIQKEHYISIVCQQQILSLRSPVTNSDDPDTILNLLLRIADDTVISEAPIDLNQIISDLRKS